MKRIIAIALLLAAAALYGQQKYALVIGNSNYANVPRLANPGNDANDMAAVLRGLGFTVETVFDGTQDQMVNAAMNLKRRLSASRNSWGFLFYAGHGVQHNGENYLIPADANIPGENFLRNRSVSVQELLDELNAAGNELNMVVLDACRDNPFGWSRSASRGLSVVGQPPADSIIVFATSAGSIAADGTGRNSPFTGPFITHLKTPGLEITEVIRRTGAAVSEASGRKQIPEVYNKFFGTAYLAGRPVPVAPVAVAPVPAVTPRPDRVVRMSAEDYYKRGEEYRKKGEWDNAIRDYNQALMDLNALLRLKPNRVSYTLRGDVYYAKRDYDRAIADYEAALRIDPDFTTAKENLEVARRAKAGR